VVLEGVRVGTVGLPLSLESALYGESISSNKNPGLMEQSCLERVCSQGSASYPPPSALRQPILLSVVLA
jgi:hypothetical protein